MATLLLKTEALTAWRDAVGTDESHVSESVTGTPAPTFVDRSTRLTACLPTMSFRTAKGRFSTSKPRAIVPLLPSLSMATTVAAPGLPARTCAWMVPRMPLSPETACWPFPRATTAALARAGATMGVPMLPMPGFGGPLKFTSSTYDGAISKSGILWDAVLQEP